MIPYGRQHVDQDDVDAVVAVLQGDWLTQGPAVEAFEGAVARRVGARHAVAFSSGSTALEGAAVAAGLGPGQLVAVPALTFVASANLARHVGADVVLLDLDPATLALDPAEVPAEVDAVVVVHYAGLPLDLAGLRHRPRVVIEDAAHALGASGPDGPVGNCAHSDLCAFSFHPVKSVTSAEGGMVTTNDDRLAERLRRFRNHGIDRAAATDPWAYAIAEDGSNHRLSDLHAALGTSQLAKLDRFVARRGELAARYDALLADLPIVLPPAAPPGSVHARHLYPIRVAGRAAAYERLRANGVGVQVHYVPLHHHPRFAAEAARSGPLPRTDEAYAGLLSLPLFPDLTEADQDRVVAEVRAAVAAGASPGDTTVDQAGGTGTVGSVGGE